MNRKAQALASLALLFTVTQANSGMLADLGWSACTSEKECTTYETNPKTKKSPVVKVLSANKPKKQVRADLLNALLKHPNKYLPRAYLYAKPAARASKAIDRTVKHKTPTMYRFKPSFVTQTKVNKSREQMAKYISYKTGCKFISSERIDTKNQRLIRAYAYQYALALGETERRAAQIASIAVLLATRETGAITVQNFKSPVAFGVMQFKPDTLKWINQSVAKIGYRPSSRHYYKPTLLIRAAVQYIKKIDNERLNPFLVMLKYNRGHNAKVSRTVYNFEGACYALSALYNVHYLKEQ